MRLIALALLPSALTLAQAPAPAPNAASAPAQKFATSGFTSRAPGATTPARGVRPRDPSQSGALAPVSLLGSVPTPSSANSLALNGNLAYVCDDNEVTIVNVANPANPQVVGTAVSNLIRNTGAIHCSIQRGALTVFADQVSTTIGNNPGFAAFSLANPSAPTLIANTAINKRFFGPPVYSGNYAFVPTTALVYFLGFLWDNSFGDLVTVDLTNFAAPTVAATLQRPILDAVYGGPNPVFNTVQADTNTLYITSTSATGVTNSGTGRLQVVDISNPLNTQVVAQLAVPGTVHLSSIVPQGPLAVGVGNTGGYVGQPNVNPIQKGNIVVAVFDTSNRRAPALVSNVKTDYVVGPGGGAARIGNNVFAFAGVNDKFGNPVLLTVDVTTPTLPLIQAYPIGQPFTSIQASGNVLYATLGAGGFATYSIPGGLTSSLSCPLSLDTVVVFDRAASVSSAAFTRAKTALRNFTNALQLPADKLGVVAVDQATATLSRTLTGVPADAKSALDTLLPGSATNGSYLGAGIAAAQTELTGPRRSPGSTQVMIIVSDGRDSAAPNTAASLSAATAAKAAGIRVIALQYGSASSTVMTQLASSAADFYLVPTP